VFALVDEYDVSRIDVTATMRLYAVEISINFDEALSGFWMTRQNPGQNFIFQFRSTKV
jgi:hypothetical protein